MSLLRLRFILKPYLSHLGVSMLNLLTLTALSLYAPRVIRQVIDDGILPVNIDVIIRSALILLGLGLLTAALSGFQRFISEWIGGHIGYDIRNKLYDHIQHLSFSYHDHAKTGQLISRCIEDTRAVQNFIGGSVVEIIQLVFLLFGALAIMFSSNWQLTLIAILPILPMVWMTFDFGNRITALFFQVDHMLGELSADRKSVV